MSVSNEEIKEGKMPKLSDAHIKFLREIGSGEIAVNRKNKRAVKTYNAFFRRSEWLIESTENTTELYLCVRLTQAGRDTLETLNRAQSKSEAEALKKKLNIVSPTDDLMKFAAAMQADHVIHP